MMSREGSRGRGAESFWDFREEFKQRVRRFYLLPQSAGDTVRESESPLAPLNERLLHLIWQRQHFDLEGLRLVDGRVVRIEDVGRLNGAGGPDFQNARLMIDGELLRGDVELHLNASGWRQHHHERDLDYNSVILHVVLFNDDGAVEDQLHNGNRLPRLELEPYLFPDLDALRRTLGPEDFTTGGSSGVGRCYEVMSSASAEEISRFLDFAGDERFNQKIRRLDDQLERAEPEQVFYQTLMSSLGSGSGKPLYYLLAKRVPLAEIRKEIDSTGFLDSDQASANQLLESLLLHVAGLIPEPPEMMEAPEESQSYAESLREVWTRLEPFWSDRIIPKSRGWYRDLRPVNFPPRRLAAVARILNRGFRMDQTPLDSMLQCVREAGRLLDTGTPSKRAALASRHLAKFFDLSEDAGFWGRHYSFPAKGSSRPMRLIGEVTARSLAFNAILPMAALVARNENDAELRDIVRRLFEIYPRLAGNHIVDFTRTRLFGKDAHPAGVFRTERRQQGLFQIFNSCCNGNLDHCDCCHYLEGLRQGWPLTAS